MSPLSKNNLIRIVMVWCFALMPMQPGFAAFSDTLLDIVQHCVDPTVPNYCKQCKAPSAAAQCTPEPSCKKTTEVWALDNDFVALRDIKMCGCPQGFVHGLVLPLQVITGVEDPLRPDSIWAFAWTQASQRIAAREIALVVNPQYKRSQNQLHVHLLRLNPQARALFDSWPSAQVRSLAEVWKVAAQLAQQHRFSDYGVLVSQSSAETFVVVVTPHSPEDLFTQYVCTLP